MSKRKKILKEKFFKFINISIIIVLLGGILLPAIIIMIDVFVGN